MNLLALFLHFVKFGLLCFGGGYPLIPLLLADFVGEGKILSAERFANLVSIAQVTPGPVGINAATFVGFQQGGFSGAVTATLGLVFPTLILMGLAASFLRRHQNHPLLKSLLYGARIGALALIWYASCIFLNLSVISLPEAGKSFSVSPSGLVIFAASAWLFGSGRFKTTWIILLSGAAGALLGPLIG